jgi:PleD family two-component response regulator
MKVKQLYWLVPTQEKPHMRIFKALQTQKIIVHQVRSFEELHERFTQKRATIIVVGDEVGEQRLITHLQELTAKPEYHGVRFVLSLSRSNPRLSRFAVAMGFRDIICRDLDSENWIKRFLFSASSAELPWMEAGPQMTTQSISAVSAPARITWINEEYLRFESKVSLPAGTQTRLFGKFSDELGLQGVSLKVTEHFRTNLRYRYSEAYVCHWEVPKSAQSRKHAILENCKKGLGAEPYKIFIAVQSVGIRKQLIEQLSDPEFDIMVALQKSGLVHEPQYLDPDVVIIEERLLDERGLFYFKKMLESIRSQTPVYILGASKEAQARFQRHAAAGQKESIITLPRLQTSFLGYLKRKLDKLNMSRQSEHGFYIPRSHHYSFAELRFPARMIQAHPESTKLLVPHELGRFGLCFLESPLLKKTINRRAIGKIANTYRHQNPQFESFPHAIEVVLSDLTFEERRQLGDQLIQTFSSELNKQIGQDKTAKNHTYITPKPKPQPVPTNLNNTERQPESLPDINISDDERPDSRRKAPSSFSERYAREIQIILVALFVFAIFLGLIYLWRQPAGEQGKEFSESFQGFYDYYRDE